MPKVFIIGAGGHARVIASLLDVTPEFLTTTPATEDERLGAAVADDPGAEFYLGLGTNRDRARVFEKLRALGARLPACVAPNVFVARDAQLGAGAVICPGAQIGSRAQVGLACIVNTLSSVDHDCVLGDYTQVTAGVTLGGTVKVGKNGFFGIKSGVIPNLTIGDDVTIMAGSLVTRNVPDRVMMGGNPARLLRRLPSSSPPSPAPEPPVPFVDQDLGRYTRVGAGKPHDVPST
jgi:sugar O-acyltransferase (sialic acid O-acetyltransferase NeuD family)